MDTLYQKMRETALKNREATAIVFYGKRYSFAKVLSLTESAAAGLSELGVKKGSTVTLCMPNTPSAQIAFYALNRLGAIVNLVHPYASAAQLDQSVTESGSSLLIAYDIFLGKKGKNLKTAVPVLKSRSDYFMSRAARMYFRLINRKKLSYRCKLFESLFEHKEIDALPQDFKGNEPSVYLPSGGTCGIPKTIMHNCRVFNEVCAEAAFFLSEPLENYKAMYSVLPIFHGFGLCMNMHMCATVGIKNVMSIRFNPRAMAKAIKKEGVNVITGVPAMFSRLLTCRRFLRADLSAVKDCFVGGDSVSKRLVEDFNRVLTAGGSKGRLYAGYGLTETVSVCVVNCKNHNKAGSTGYPMPGTKLKIVKDGKAVPAGEIGEICISTPFMMLGYLSGGESIKAEDGERWLYTGDLGYLDGDGFLYFKQRIKNMIKVKGVPVFPSEIEEVVESVSGVVRAAAVGIDDEVMGQAVKLFVESKEANIQKLKEAILAECRLKLMPYATPKHIEVRDSLPLNIIGKVDRNKL